jgi:hypothetical protein
MQTTDRSGHRWYPLVREWDRQLRSENKSPKTIQGYLDSTWQLITWLDHLRETPDESPDRAADDGDLARPDEPADITKSHLIGWINHLLSINAPGTAHNRYRAVQQWFNWLLDEGEIDAHPMARMKYPASGMSGPPAFSCRRCPVARRQAVTNKPRWSVHQYLAGKAIRASAPTAQMT